MALNELYLGNLPFEVNARELHRVLENLCCPAKQICVSNRAGTKGKAKLTFYTAEDCSNALHMLKGNEDLYGRKLFCSPWPEGGWKQLQRDFLQYARS